MTYPQPTDKLGDLALAIQNLATWADSRLPGTGVEVLTGVYPTNVSGDLSFQFQTITNVDCVIQTCYYSGGQPNWVVLTIPVFAILPSWAPDIIVARAYTQIGGQAFANVSLYLCIYGWGTPK
jgi:hypothetical protein